MKKTYRGFDIYCEVKDNRGQEIRVQESSSAEEPAVWIFCNKDGKDAIIHLGEPLAYSPHLTKSQAREVAEALLKFAKSK